MSNTAFETVETTAALLKVDLTAQELAILAEKEGFTEDELNAIQSVFSYLEEKKKKQPYRRCSA